VVVNLDEPESDQCTAAAFVEKLQLEQLAVYHSYDNMILLVMVGFHSSDTQAFS